MVGEGLSTYRDDAGEEGDVVADLAAAQHTHEPNGLPIDWNVWGARIPKPRDSTEKADHIRASHILPEDDRDLEQ